MPFLSSLFGHSNQQTAQMGTMLDTVTYTAGLASNPEDIDPALDKVRSITAELIPGQQLSQEATEALIGVYLEIEGYLVTKEPLRAFTKEALRSRLSPGVRQQIETYETNHK